MDILENAIIDAIGFSVEIEIVYPEDINKTQFQDIDDLDDNPPEKEEGADERERKISAFLNDLRFSFGILVD